MNHAMPLSSKVKLGDYLTVLTDYHANGSYERLKENVTLLNDSDFAVMIRTTNFEKDDFNEDLKYISEHAYHYLKKSKVYPGDILMNKIATPGNVYRMPNLGRPVSLAMNLFLLRTDETRLNQTYAYYWLKANEPYVKSFACGAATATITKKAVRDLEIHLPNIAAQQRISGVLSAYDDLIENSQRRIKILESMARALYREWFVHFRIPAEVLTKAAVSPKKFFTSPLGDIPQGWGVKKLGDLCNLTKDSYKDAEHSELPLLDLARMPSRSLAPSDTGTPAELTTSRIIFQKGDTLFGAIRCYLHKVVVMHYAGVTNTSVLVLRPKAQCFRSLLAIVASDFDTIRWAETQSTGTKMPVINWGVFQGMPSPVPSKALAQAFEEIAGPMLDEIGVLSTKIQNLRRTRDLLLPRLLSGQVNFESEITV